MTSLRFTRSRSANVHSNFSFRLCTLLILLIGFSTTCMGQKLDDYFRYKAVKMIGDFAHPSNTYRSGTYAIYPGYFGKNGDLIMVDVYYNDNYHTQIALRRNYGFFVELAVIQDNDFVVPFKAMQLMKDIMVQYMQATDNTTRTTVETALERQLKRKLVLSNGNDLTLYMINLEWFDY